MICWQKHGAYSWDSPVTMEMKDGAILSLLFLAAEDTQLLNCQLPRFASSISDTHLTLSESLGLKHW